MSRPQAPRGTKVDVPAPPHAPARDRPSADVALLAATALGFAYASTASDEVHARRLATLADPDPESLFRAQTAVLALEIGTAQARTRAASLLRRAAGSVGGQRDAGLRTEKAATGASMAATIEDRR
jgi:hypothetical protein